MAATGKLRVVNAQAFTGNGTTTAVSVNGKTDQFVAFLNVTAIGAGTSLVVTLQHSPDNSNWFTLCTFAAKTATGVEIIPQGSFTSANSPVLPNVRASLAFTGGTTTATVSVELMHDVK